METTTLEIEGTAEEIQARLTEFAGQHLRVTIAKTGNGAEPAPRKMSIEEKLRAIFQEIPLEERGTLPTDLSENLDHYIYGWPKK